MFSCSQALSLALTALQLDGSSSDTGVEFSALQIGLVGPQDAVVSELSDVAHFGSEYRPRRKP